MERTIFRNGTQRAVIIEESPTHYEVTAYVDETPTVAYTATTAEEAARWAKAVIEYNE
jgi:hypothetical protein